MDLIDMFIVRETNKTDKIVAAILAAALYNRQENDAAQQKNMDQLIDLWAQLLLQMKDKNLSTLGQSVFMEEMADLQAVRFLHGKHRGRT